MRAEHHPDAEWLARDLSDISAWLEVSPRTPTSSVTGGGAVAEVEKVLSGLHLGRPTLAVPSATYGMRVALAALGVEAGDSVLVPALDWSSTSAAVRSLGATPIYVQVDSHTLTIDPDAAAGLRTRRVRAVVACHLHGVPADVLALRNKLDGLPIVEDAAQAFGGTLDGYPIGALGDVAVFSFGPGKTIQAGEAGAVVFHDDTLREKAIQLASHPVRQLLAGIANPAFGELSIRVHPLAAVLLASRLRRWDLSAERLQTAALADAIAELSGVHIIDRSSRAGVAPGPIPVYAAADFDFAPHSLAATQSGARWLAEDAPAHQPIVLPLCITRQHHPTAEKSGRG